jgi:ribosomal protein S18 acetylase RimI-like enzyme
MNIRIMTPVSEKDIEFGRELGYQYAAAITKDPILKEYFESRSILADIDKMPHGFEPPDGAYLLAYVGDAPAGIVALKRLEDDICEMKRLFVSPEFQGIGLGRLLIEQIIKEGKRLGYAKMRLDSSRSVMAKAVLLYRSMGFYEIEPYNQNFVPDALFMEKVLAD